MQLFALSQSSTLARTSLLLALGSGVAAMGSIAVSQILLGATLACLLLNYLSTRELPRMPRYWQALALFMAWSVASWLINGDLREGRFQIRKFYVLLIAMAMASTMRTLAQLRWLALGWIGVATASATWGLHQFWMKWQVAQAAHDPFYRSYLGTRITGFSGHWMTFSEQVLFAAIAGAALLVWDRQLSRVARILLVTALLICGLALVAAMTRGVWLAALVAFFYMMWNWRRWAVVAFALVLVTGVALAPANVRERVASIVEPHGDIDSNSHRYVSFRTGVAMIAAHPLFGIGPDMVQYEFNRYVPADIQRPLPEGFYGHLHCIYTQYAAERGIVAMLAMVAFFALHAWRWRGAIRRGGNAWFLHAGVALVLSILVTGLFEHNLGDSEILTLSLVGVAAIAAVADHDERVTS